MAGNFGGSGEEPQDDGRGGGRRAGVLRLPERAPGENPLHEHAERLNKEVKRRADVVGIFPNEESIMRLLGAVLTEQNEEWLLQNRYLPQHSMAKIDQTAEERIATGKKGHRDTGGHRLVLQQKTVISRRLHSVTRE